MRAVVSDEDRRKLSPDQADYVRSFLKDVSMVAAEHKEDADSESNVYVGKFGGHQVRFEQTKSKHKTRQQDNQVVAFVDGKQVHRTRGRSSVSRAVVGMVIEGKIVPKDFPVSDGTQVTSKAAAQGPTDDIVVNKDTVIVYGIELERFPNPGPLTPTADQVTRPKGVGDQMQAVAAALAHCYPVGLYGDTGTGKTTILEYLAHLCNANLVKVVGDPEYGPSLWLGHLHAKGGDTFWVDGDLPTAMKGVDGKGQTWLFVDEASRMLPDNTAPLLPVLETRGGKHGRLRLADNPDPVTKNITSHEDLRIVLAWNPFDMDFAGTHEMDLALLRRISVQLEIDYPDPDTQLSILKERHPNTDRVTLRKICAIAAKLRGERKARRLNVPCSPAELDAWVDLIPSLGRDRAAEVTIANKARVEERARVRELLEI